MTIRCILPIALALVTSAVQAAPALVARSVTNDIPSRPLVRLAVTAATGTVCHAYEEFLPATLTATNVTGGGTWVPDLHAIRWGPFTNTPSVELTYRVVGPPGTYVPGGRLSSDGAWAFTPVEIPVTIAAEGGSDIPPRPGTVATPVITPAGSTSLPVTVTISCPYFSLVFKDDFESGNVTNWAVMSGATALSISTAQNQTPGGANSAYMNSTLNRMYHNLGTKVDGQARATFWIYDSTQTRAYGDVRGYSGAGYNDGALIQLFGAGKYSGVTMPGETYDGTKYQGRVVAGTNAGWFNLNASGAPSRSTGWHEFQIERLADGATVNFYVDGVFSRRITGATNAGLDSVTIGSIGSGSTAGNSWVDDVKVEHGETAAIRYTLDASLPNETSTLYTGAVNVASTTWLRARAFVSNAFPSAVCSAWFAEKAPWPTLTTTRSVVTNTPWLTAISIVATQMTGALCWAYEERLPLGLVVSNITENGIFDSTNRVVKWGPFVGRAGATLSYQAFGRAGTYSVRGRWSVDGYATEETASYAVAVASAPGSGDDYPVRPATVAKPVMTPATSTSLPVTVTVSCVTSGAVLRYTLDGTAPTSASALYTTTLNFTSDTVLRVRGFKTGLDPSSVASGVYARTSSIAPPQVTRTISGNSTPSPSVELLVVPSAGTKCYAVTETISEGLAPYSISHSGAWDESNRVLKWGPFFGSDVVRLQYILGGMPGTYRLVGAGSADGLSSVTTGPDTIEMAAQEALPDLVPAVVSFERAISVIYSVTNRGKGVAAAHWTDRWYDTFYLSGDTNLDSGDTLLGSFIGNNGLSLAAGASYTASNSLAFPETAGGDYYLILRTDERGMVNEANEANNTVAIPITIPTLDGTPDRVLEMPVAWGGTNSPGSLDFSPDGVRLAVAASPRVGVWNLQSHASASNAMLGSFTGHVASVSTVRFSPANDEVLSGSSDGTIRVWDGRTFLEARRFSSTSGEPSPAAFSADGARVLGGAARGVARIWDAVVPTNTLRTLTGHSASITAVAFSPDGTRALTGSSDKSAILWNAATGAILYRWTNHTHAISAVAFSRDGSRALTASSDGTIRIWNPTTGAAVAILRQGRPISAAVFSPDGLYIAAADRGLPGMAYLWEVSSGKVLRSFRPFNVNPSTTEGIAFSPDRAAIATSHSDGLVRLWDSGLAAIPIHTAAPLPIGTDVPFTMQSHGLYYFEIDVPANRSLVVTVDAAGGGGGGLKASPSSLAGPTASGLSSDVRFANRAESQDTAQAGLMKALAIGDFPPEADIEAFRVLATRDHLPSVYEYDHFAQASITNLHAELPLSAIASNKSYVLVFAPWLSAGQINATIKAEFTSLHLSSISHQSGGNAGTVTVQMHGTAFGSNTFAMLTQVGGSGVVSAAPLYQPSPNEMEVRFDLRSATPGIYDVAVADGTEIATIPRGFEIVGGGVGAASAATFVPSVVRVGRATDFSILVKNDGMTDIGPLAIKASLAGSTAPFWVGVVPQLGPRGQTPITVPMPPVQPGCDKLTVTTGDPRKENCEIQDRILTAWRAIIAAEEATLQVIRDDLSSECGNTLPRNSPERCERLHQQEVKLEWHIFELKQLCCNLCRARNVTCPDDPDDCGECTELLQNPTDHVDSQWDADFCAVRAVDPNDKIGPAGVGPDRLISVQDEMAYTIRFENFASATAPVQELVVVDYLDPNLDWSTVEFSEIRYGDRVLTVPAGQLNFSTRDLPPTNSIAITGITLGRLAVDITANFNAQNGRLEWRLVARDTADNQFPDDALAGFLPPNNTNTHCGEGYLTFRVKPKLGLEIGTRIENKASIVFDFNDPVETPVVFNTIGQVEPKLGATIAYPASEMHLGLKFNFSLTVTNSGFNAATNVVITNTIPAGFAFVNATSTVGTVTYTNGNVIWTIDALSNGVPATLTLTLLPAQGGYVVLPIRIRGDNGLVLDLDPLFSVQPPVVLGIRLNKGQVELFWSTNSRGFHLQRASSLSASTQWSDLTNAPVIVGQQYFVTNGPPTGIQFYRLSNENATTTARPPISIQLLGAQLQLSWPTNAANFHLQSSLHVGASATWADVTNTPASSGGLYRVTIGTPGSTRYFRLTKP